MNIWEKGWWRGGGIDITEGERNKERPRGGCKMAVGKA